MKVILPSRLEKGSNSAFIHALHSGISESHLEIDFSQLQFSYPLSMLKVGTYIRQVVKLRRQLGIPTIALNIDKSRSCHGYLDHIGFFDFIGLKDTNPIGSARGSSTYIPIQRITRTEIDADVFAQGSDLHGIILDHASKLSRLFLGFDEDVNYPALKYVFKEIIRNVFEHSQADECFIAGQKWRDGKIQFSILDEGIGVQEAVQHKIEDPNPKTALEHALKPGFSRVDFSSPELNVFNNSGYGLFILSELGREFGWFEIGTSGGSLLVNGSGEKFGSLPPFRGTYVGLSFNSTRFDIDEKLLEIVHNGEVEAAILGFNRKASSSSKVTR